MHALFHVNQQNALYISFKYKQTDIEPMLTSWMGLAGWLGRYVCR